MVWYGFVPGWQILLLPVFVAAGAAGGDRAGAVVGRADVKYRDFRFIIPFIVQFGLYVSPVGFSSAVVPEQWRLLYSLNPMVGVIDGFRWCILGGDSPIYVAGLPGQPRRRRRHLWVGMRVTSGAPSAPSRTDLNDRRRHPRRELGKKYIIGHRAEEVRCLRDVLSRSARNCAAQGCDMLRGRAMVEGDESRSSGRCGRRASRSSAARSSASSAATAPARSRC